MTTHKQTPCQRLKYSVTYCFCEHSASVHAKSGAAIVPIPESGFSNAKVCRRIEVNATFSDIGFMRTQTGKFTGRIGALRFLPMGAAEARARLSGLQLNPRLAPYVRNEIKACDGALRALEAHREDDQDLDEAVRQVKEQVEQTIRTARRRYEQSGRLGRDRPQL